MHGRGNPHHVLVLDPDALPGGIDHDDATGSCTLIFAAGLHVLVVVAEHDHPHWWAGSVVALVQPDPTRTRRERASSLLEPPLGIGFEFEALDRYVRWPHGGRCVRVAGFPNELLGEASGFSLAHRWRRPAPRINGHGRASAWRRAR